MMSSHFFVLSKHRYYKGCTTVYVLIMYLLCVYVNAILLIIQSINHSINQSFRSDGTDDGRTVTLKEENMYVVTYFKLCLYLVSIISEKSDLTLSL